MKQSFASTAAICLALVFTGCTNSGDVTGGGSNTGSATGTSQPPRTTSVPTATVTITTTATTTSPTVATESPSQFDVIKDSVNRALAQAKTETGQDGVPIAVINPATETVVGVLVGERVYAFSVPETGTPILIASSKADDDELVVSQAKVSLLQALELAYSYSPRCTVFNVTWDGDDTAHWDVQLLPFREDVVYIFDVDATTGEFNHDR